MSSGTVITIGLLGWLLYMLTFKLEQLERITVFVRGILRDTGTAVGNAGRTGVAAWKSIKNDHADAGAAAPPSWEEPDHGQ